MATSRVVSPLVRVAAPALQTHPTKETKRDCSLTFEDINLLWDLSNLSPEESGLREALDSVPPLAAYTRKRPRPVATEHVAEARCLAPPKRPRGGNWTRE